VFPEEVAREQATVTYNDAKGVEAASNFLRLMATAKGS